MALKRHFGEMKSIKHVGSFYFFCRLELLSGTFILFLIISNNFFFLKVNLLKA